MLQKIFQLKLQISLLCQNFLNNIQNLSLTFNGHFFSWNYFWDKSWKYHILWPTKKILGATVDFSSGVFHNNKMAIYRTGSKLKCLWLINKVFQTCNNLQVLCKLHNTYKSTTFWFNRIVLKMPKSHNTTKERKNRIQSTP